ncbi:metallophosphoesterase family protein [Neobacillus sp. D3-1R]|uniref:metallophosphoesterase family protein n=1 Tax=Neobacillus sp. D3-1R TaxID=3445778 RepID=UPI003FA15A2D
MSRVLVVSDSHGLTNELEKIKEKHQAEVDLMIHCGDSELQADDPAIKDFVMVGGNCDFGSDFPKEKMEIMNQKSIFITHGHHYHVKSSLMSLVYRAEEVNANIVCFGHSHILGAEVINGILFINPGSIRLPKMRKEKTYVIVEIEGDKILFNVYDINLGMLPMLNHEFHIQS